MCTCTCRTCIYISSHLLNLLICMSMSINVHTSKICTHAYIYINISALKHPDLRTMLVSKHTHTYTKHICANYICVYTLHMCLCYTHFHLHICIEISTSHATNKSTILHIHIHHVVIHLLIFIHMCMWEITCLQLFYFTSFIHLDIWICTSTFSSTHHARIYLHLHTTSSLFFFFF